MKANITLLKYAWEKERKLCLIVLGRYVFEAAVSLIDILGLGVIVDALVTGKGRNEVFQTIGAYVLIRFLISLARQLFAWADFMEMRRSTNREQYRYARHSLEVDYPFVQSGDFLTLRENSKKVMPGFYMFNYGKFISYAVKFIGVLSIFSQVSPLLIAGLVLLSVPPILLAFRQKKAEFGYEQETVPFTRRGDYLYRVMTEYGYAKDLRIYGGEEMLCEKYEDNARKQLKKQDALEKKRTAMKSAAYFFEALQLLVMLFSFSYMVYRGDISIAQYTVLLASTTLFVSSLSGFFDNVAYLKKMSGYAELQKQYDSLVRDNSRVYAAEQLEQGPGKEPLTIDFEHVSFHYPGSGRLILDDVSFHIGSGETVSFVGENGAGKTTVIKLLLRLYEPTSGVIRVNGTPIGELNSGEYYERIGIVLQEFFLFAYSVRENLCFDRAVEESRIGAAVREAGLEERILRLPRGLDTSLYKRLDPEGVELSGGEGQKLALARALCKDTGLLILDEPTSSLDPMAEYELFSKMRRIAQDRTAIVVSHRLSSTRYSDRIFVLEHGRLVQEGSHSELLREEGVYRKLYTTQARYYTGEGNLYAE